MIIMNVEYILLTWLYEMQIIIYCYIQIKVSPPIANDLNQLRYLGHSGQIGNMRHSGTLKTQNCQYEKLWKYYWLFSCSYHTRWEKNNGQAYLTHRVHVVRVFENLMSRNDEMKVWSSPGLETHLFLSHVDCISSIMMTQIKKIFFLQFLTYVPS